MRAISAAALALAIALCGAANAADTYHVMGSGQHTCQDWTDAETHNLKAFMVIDRQWVLGFLSGYSKATAGADPLNESVTTTGVFAFVDMHCQQAPKDTIAEAADAFAAASAGHK